MDVLFGFLTLISFSGIIIGMIKPALVIRWGEDNKTRKNVLKVYGLALFVCFIIFGMVSEVSVKDKVKTARERVDNQEYGAALEEYEAAIENWDEEEDYSFTKSEIETELKNTERQHKFEVIGNKKWEFEFDEVIHNPVIGNKGTIYLGSGNKLYALNKDGSKKWTFTASNEDKNIYSPVLKEETIYFTSGNTLYALNKEGKKKWTYKLNSNNSLYTPSVADNSEGIICLGSENNYIYALNKSGDVKWEFQTEGEVFNTKIKDGMIFAASTDNNLYALTNEGKKKWSFETKDSIYNFALKDDTLYFIAGSTLYALDNKGREKWSRDFNEEMIFREITVHDNGYLYFFGVSTLPDKNNILFAINKNGKKEWSYKYKGEGSFDNLKIANDGTVYFGAIQDNKKLLCAINYNNTKMWTTEVNNFIKYPVVDKKGNIYFRSEEEDKWKLYAFQGILPDLKEQFWENFNEEYELEVVSNLSKNATRRYINIDREIFKENDLIKLEVDIPNSYGFRKWEGGVFNNSEQTTLIRMDKDKKIKAVYDEFAGGIGTEDKPYLVSNENQLDNIRYYLDSNFEQVADIDLAGYEWESIGEPISDYKIFKGVFNGKNYKIENLSPNGRGLFSRQSGVIRNIHIDNSDIVEIEKGNGGVLVGINEGVIRNSKVTGNLKTTDFRTGGLVGTNSGEIYNCFYRGEIEGHDNFLGGLVGVNEGLIKESKMKGNLNTQGKIAGGIVGENSGGKVEDSYFEGNIECNFDGTLGGEIGGIVGINEKGTLKNVYSNGKIKSKINSVGGIVGLNKNGKVYESYANIDVEGKEDVGGLVGTNADAIIKNSYSEGNVTGEKNVGGLVGGNTGSIINTFTNGKVNGNENVGGLIGQDMEEFSVITNSYWNLDKSNQAYSDGGTGKGRTQMKNRTTYYNWDFNNIWQIEEGRTYPYLQWENNN